MDITVEHIPDKMGVAILHLQGELDGSNFQALIAKGKETIASGVHYLLLNMSGLSYMSSAGIVALHSIALMAQGKEAPDPEAGWAAFHAIDYDRDSGLQQHVKLLSPQPPVDRALEKTGMKQFFEVHQDVQAAIASFPTV